MATRVFSEEELERLQLFGVLITVIPFRRRERQLIYQTTLAYFQQALPIHRAVGDRAGEAVTCYNIAMIYRDRGDLARAITELEQVVDLDRQVGHPTWHRTPPHSNAYVTNEQAPDQECSRPGQLVSSPIQPSRIP